MVVGDWVKESRSFHNFNVSVVPDFGFWARSYPLHRQIDAIMVDS